MPKRTIWLYADPVRLSQVFSNILVNAAKYTPPGGKIHVAVEVENDQAVINVTDTGVGIEKSAMGRIFEPFVSINPGSRVTTGLGIGLALTKRLVEMHGGTVEASSAGRGTGSTFTVRLPLTPAPAPAENDTNSSTEGHSLRPKRVLIVDDNIAAAQGLGKLLMHRGHRTRIVHTGEKALQAGREFKPDIVLLDIGLPDIDGYEVASRMRANLKPCPILIALSGYGQDEDKEKAKNAGFHHHLPKPVGLKDIEAAFALFPDIPS